MYPRYTSKTISSPPWGLGGSRACPVVFPWPLSLSVNSWGCLPSWALLSDLGFTAVVVVGIQGRGGALREPLETRQEKRQVSGAARIFQPCWDSSTKIFSTGLSRAAWSFP